MVQVKKRISSEYGAVLCVAYALVVWVLFANQSLVFPLGDEDQRTATVALRDLPDERGPSWVAAALDPLVAGFLPGNPYPLMQFFRRLAATLAVVGTATWVWRSCGWALGLWVAVLGVGHLPLRIVAGALLPQSFCLAFLVWGGLFALGRPWSKTGTAEQLGGGFLLGCAWFAAPWGFLYSLALPIHTAVSSSFRKGFERPFWIGYLSGLAPGVLWLVVGFGGSGRDWGIRPGSLGGHKMWQILELMGDSWGLVFTVSVAIGVFACGRWPEREMRGWPLDFVWPFVPSILLGYADAPRASLAFPGLIVLSALGYRAVGRLLVNRTEQKLIPSLVVLAVGYHAFFSGLPGIRERQAHSREVASLAELLLSEARPGDPVAFFRLEAMVDYLNALHPRLGLVQVGASAFPSQPERVSSKLGGLFPGKPFLWLDRKRAMEKVGGLGSSYVETLLHQTGTEHYLGKNSSELLRIRLSSGPHVSW